MKKKRITENLRKCVKERLSISKQERDLVSTVYSIFRKILNDNCIQIGSYPRFTAISPMNDLDILYLLGHWDQASHDPSESLNVLSEKIKEKIEGLQQYKSEVSLQTHSVSVIFKSANTEIFSVDIVPAYSYSQNEFGQDKYWIPEVVRQKHGLKRKDFYKTLQEERLEMKWIFSDPRGYIEVAKRLNNNNEDFRRTAKFVKGWNDACKQQQDDFALKSFHIEQLVTIIFQNHPQSDIFDGIFEFFYALPENINAPSIADRADRSKHIDSYLDELTCRQRESIIESRDHFMKALEDIKDDESIDHLLDVDFYKRASSSEKYLFDLKIPTLTDDKYSLKIMGEVQAGSGGYRKHILDLTGGVSAGRKIKFRIKGNAPDVEHFKWKVKNDNSSPEPRGEITDNRTKSDPESTKYIGNHYVECYAILDNVCVAKARQNVKIKKW